LRSEKQWGASIDSFKITCEPQWVNQQRGRNRGRFPPLVSDLLAFDVHGPRAIDAKLSFENAQNTFGFAEFELEHTGGCFWR